MFRVSVPDQNVSDSSRSSAIRNGATSRTRAAGRPRPRSAIRIERARAVEAELVHAWGRERRHHALAARATDDEEHALWPRPEADQIACIDEDPRASESFRSD